MKTEGMKYKHHCRFCGHSWLGRKKEIVSCVKCHLRFDYVHKRKKR